MNEKRFFFFAFFFLDKCKKKGLYNKRPAVFAGVFFEVCVQEKKDDVALMLLITFFSCAERKKKKHTKQ